MSKKKETSPSLEWPTLTPIRELGVRRNPKRSSTVFSKSRTMPGQSLTPSKLLERHLAGTLPDIDHSRMYEYHYDENGEQIAVPLPLDMIELQKLLVKSREAHEASVVEKRKKDAEALRSKLVDDWKASPEGQAWLRSVQDPPGNSGPKPPAPSGD